MRFINAMNAVISAITNLDLISDAKSTILIQELLTGAIPDVGCTQAVGAVGDEGLVLIHSPAGLEHLSITEEFIRFVRTVSISIANGVKGVKDMLQGMTITTMKRQGLA